jgi:hypothetical protein
MLYGWCKFFPNAIECLGVYCVVYMETTSHVKATGISTFQMREKKGGVTIQCNFFIHYIYSGYRFDMIVLDLFFL